MQSHGIWWWGLLLASLLGVAGCSGFTERDGATSGDGAPGDGPRTGVPRRDGLAAPHDGFAAGGSGPGPFGALPSGYCCESDLDCRYRQCVDFGDSKMCMDPCQTDDGCKGKLSGLHCNPSTERCEPDASGTKCVVASTFQYGVKPLGACCVATHDGWAGAECQGNHCDAFGAMSNPYICTNVCYKPADCPRLFYCLSTGSGYGLCVPQADPYTCTP